MKLIDSLDGIIPEAKMSNWKSMACETTKETSGYFLSELREDLAELVLNRERRILDSLNTKLNDFRNDLFVLSKQLKMVTKHDC